MQKVWLLLFLFAAVYAESQVRETETWVPRKPQTDWSLDQPESSGDHPGSDFGFTKDDDEDADDDDDTYDDYDDDFSGSGDDDKDMDIAPTEPDVIDNQIPDEDKSPKRNPMDDDIEAVQKNEVGPRLGATLEDALPNVLMAHASDEGVFSKPEVVAALIAGGAVGLLFAILLILLLIYRMKKKDEGSYDLGKKPIYTKAPTAEIYA
ncbi:hypothetical protein SKAU_G00151130 [Synaphobranchus kaupii]|uniref:Syndecan n=1 Tax=Synaphobranchus kaupii TaxID=118154 RepID=A0A9Q1FGT3_SYNKA|nr:hypothetical protein SKAU_G00151130 [Synaphobranchus kaupii]